MAKKQYNVRTSAVAATERRARKYGVAAGSVGAGGYIDVAGDVAGKLDRGVFESMFERIVTGTDDDGNEKWYIKAKATLVSVGDVVAYGVSDITGGGGGSSTLANLKDVLLGTLKDGDVIKWDASLGKWVNGQGGGGLDEDQLAAYLQQHNYVTSSDLGNVMRGVSLDYTGDFDANALAGSNYTIYDTTGDIQSGSGSWVNFPFKPAGGFTLTNLKEGNYRKQFFTGYANNRLYVRSQYYAANVGYTFGAWDSFALTSDLANYVSALGTSGDNLTWTKNGIANSLTVPYAIAASNLYNSGGASDLNTGLPRNGLYSWTPDTANRPTNYGVVLQWSNTNSTYNGNGCWLTQLASATESGGLYYRTSTNGSNWDAWERILTHTNYPAYLDSRYVNVAGDSMTGSLTVPFGGLIVGSRGGENTPRVLAAYNTGWNNYHYLTFGNDPSNANAGEIGYEYKGAGSSNNHIFMGFYGKAGLDITYGGGITAFGNTLWHAGNDGSGSGLDADLLDGRHGSDYVGIRYLGWQSDTHGAFVVLCPAYAGSLTNGGWFYGSVTITRGNAGAYNSKTEVLVQCGGQYNSNQGGYQVLYQNVSISGLFVISYNGARYIALGMDPASTMEFRVQGQWSGMTPFLIDSEASGLSWISDVAKTPHISSNASSATKLQTARSLWGNSFNGESGCDGGLTFGLLTGTNARDLLFQQMADNDLFRIRCGGTASNAGWVEIATADDGTEPIYVRQYTGSFTTITRTLTLLDGSGNTSVPGTLVAGGDVTAYSDARLKSDIRPLRNRGFIEPKTYIKDGKRCIGFLAQDVMAIYPELVTETGGVDNWLALNYGNFVAVLEAQIIDIDTRLKRLEARA